MSTLMAGWQPRVVVTKSYRYRMQPTHLASAGLRTGQTGQLPRGLHKKGPPQKHIFFKYMAVSYSVCHRGLLVNVCKFHFNYAFYTEVNG